MKEYEMDNNCLVFLVYKRVIEFLIIVHQFLHRYYIFFE